MDDEGLEYLDIESAQSSSLSEIVEELPVRASKTFGHPMSVGFEAWKDLQFN